jgi:hypothetical protein
MIIPSGWVVIRYKPPNRQLVIILTGTVEIGDSNGNTQELNPGNAALAVDTPRPCHSRHPTNPPSTAHQPAQQSTQPSVTRAVKVTGDSVALTGRRLRSGGW